MRKQRLAAAALTALFLATLLPLSAADAVHMGNGIKSGAITQTSAVIWTRLTKTPEANWKGTPFDHAKLPRAEFKKLVKSGSDETYDLPTMKGSLIGACGEVRVKYAPKGQPNAAGKTSWRSVDPGSDFTKQFKLPNLIPGTTYSLLVEGRADRDSKPTCTVKGQFKTAPAKEQAAPVTFTVVTGQSFYNRDNKDMGHQIFPAMQTLDPNFMVHTGDEVYHDRPGPYATTAELARMKWNRTYALPFQRDFHNNVATYFQKDDHDITMDDSWPGKNFGNLTWVQGLKIFNEQTPNDGLPYKTIRFGKDLQIWLTEGRQFRSPNRLPDGPDKTIWGKKQKDWFFRTVEESDATFRVLINATPIVGPDRITKKDNHANKVFAHEGNELRAFISKQKNMFVACGDRHWQYVSQDPKTGLREYSCGPMSDAHAGGFTDDQKSSMHKFLRVKGGFLSVTVDRKDDKPMTWFRHHDVNGKVVNEESFSAE